MDEKTLNEILKFIESEYEVTSKIMQSGQRTVYRASNSLKDTEIFVLKTAPVSPTSVARIKRELKLLLSLNSTYFPKSHFQQFITGEDLEYFIDNFNPKKDTDRIEAIRKMGIKPFFITVENFVPHQQWSNFREQLSQEKQLVVFLGKLFDGLKLLWDEKIVHRDLKPENILVNEELHPVIIDLGVAKSLRDGTEAITHPLALSPCTPQYASPEQLTNNKAEVTYKSDQFSVGVISFWVLTGKYPYGQLGKIDGETLIDNLLNERMEDLQKLRSDLNSKTVSFITKLLRKNPYQRFRSYDDIKVSLQEIEEEL